MSISQAPASPARARIPATVITGFLGAGKTSLIRHAVEATPGRRLALVINEFGDLGVDGGLLRGCGIPNCRDGDIIELANGCICCTVADEFLPVMEALVARPEPPDAILIETSGLALPKPLLKAFAWPEIRSRVTVDGVIAVIDADAVQDGRFADDPALVAAQREADGALDHDNPLAEVFEDQLNAADLVVLNKADLLGKDALSQMMAEIRAQLRPGVKLVPTSHGVVAPEILLGLGAGAEDDLAARPSVHDGLAGDHDHDDFESFTIALGAVTDPAALLAMLGPIVAAHDILRLKGFVAVAGREFRHVIQGVGGRINGYYDRPWQPGEARLSRLVIIGQKGLDQGAIRAGLASLAGAEAAE